MSPHTSNDSPTPVADQSSLLNWWYCVQHHTVEQGPGCPGDQRLGPYDSQEQAQMALQRVEQRNHEWNEDPLWAPEDEKDEVDAWGQQTVTNPEQ